MAPAAQPQPEGYRYDGFLSYRRVEPDESQGQRLFQAIERLRIPHSLRRPGAKPHLRLFRDLDEMTPGGQLGDTLAGHLRDSRNLIVLCSPRTPESEWVAREIAIFRELGRGDRIVPVLLSGNPESSFPDALRAGKAEPFAPDLSPRPGETADTRLRLEAIRVAARLLDCDFETLRQRHRTWQRLVRLAITAVALVLIIAIVFAVRADQERLRKQLQAKAGALASAAQTQHEDPELAALLALQALRFDRRSGGESTTQVHAALAAVATAPFAVTLRPPENAPSFSGCAFSTDGRHLATTAVELATDKVRAGLVDNLEGIGGVVSVLDLIDSSAETQQRSFEHAPVLVAFGEGDRLVVGCTDAIRIWPPGTGLGGEPQELTPGVAIDGGWGARPGGRRIAFVGNDASLRLLDLSGTTALIHELQAPDRLRSLSDAPPLVIDREGRYLATASGDTAYVWDLTQIDARPFELQASTSGDLSEVQFSGDGRHVYALHAGGEAVAWSLASRKQLTKPPCLPAGLPVESMQWSFREDGELAAATATGTGRLVVWNPSADARNTTPLLLVLAESFVQRPSFSPDHSRLAVASPFDIRLWDVSFSNHRFPSKQIARAQVVSADEANPDLTDRLFGVGIASMAVAPDGATVAAATARGIGKDDLESLYVWSLRDPTAEPHIRTWNQGEGGLPFGSAADGCHVAFSTDGRLLAFSSQHGLRLLRTDALAKDAVEIDDAEGVDSMQFLPSAQSGAYRFLTAGDRGVVLWTLATDGSLASSAFGPCLVARKIVASRDGHWIAAGDDSDTASRHAVMIWNVAEPLDPRCIELSSRLQSLAMSPDGSHLAAGTRNGVVQIWATDSLASRLRIEVADGVPRDLAFSPCEPVLAVAVGSKDVSFADSMNLQQQFTEATMQRVSGRVFLLPIDGDHGARNQIELLRTSIGIDRLTFSADGVFVAAATHDRRITLLPATVQSLEDCIERSVRRSLTAEEWGRFVGAELPYDDRDEGRRAR